ncbi:hypothetical protein DD238_004872 [Peronospora effusa]|uniref:Uncharacterized protein n=1 Tax=Peronospora effusa TaxID=542832 RepID=A0A3M6VJF7_9STRA|nr:hypothetical protein DD238_004872 [Peronospora effusa]RQM15362.1 hypothetical protein DD237_005364 [Peronospora effusa]
MWVIVGGKLSREMAKGVAHSVSNSPLLKCAVTGHDSNVCRLLMAGYFSLTTTSCSLQRQIEINAVVESEKSQVLGVDLANEYETIDADSRLQFKHDCSGLNYK